jgi:hypothetical protein
MQGDATASPFIYLLAATPNREGHQSEKSGGAGAKPSHAPHATNLSPSEATSHNE